MRTTTIAAFQKAIELRAAGLPVPDELTAAGMDTTSENSNDILADLDELSEPWYAARGRRPTGGAAQ